jgi:hypothetical protein
MNNETTTKYCPAWAPKSYSAAIESDARAVAAHCGKWRHEFASRADVMAYANSWVQGKREGWSARARTALRAAARKAVASII